MAGAWELPRHRLDVLVGIPHTGMVPFQWAIAFKELRFAPRTEIAFVSGQPFDMARNNLAQSAVDRDAEWLFFLDSDVTPPPDAIARLLALNVPLASGVYYRRNSPITPAFWKEKENGISAPEDYPRTAAFEVDLVGAGCLLIHRSIFERLSKPWFEWTLGRLPKPFGCSEDFYFLRKVRKELGIRPVIDASVQCGHIGLFVSDVDGVAPANEPKPPMDRLTWLRRRGTGKILDIGSHNGVLFGKDNPNVVALDLDVYPLERFVQGNAAALPFRDQGFDTVVMGEIIEHVPDPVRVMREAARVGKKVVITTPNEHEWDAKHKPFEHKRPWKEGDAEGKTKAVAAGTEGAVRRVDEERTPHLYHARAYTKDTLLEDLMKSFKEFRLELLRYDGWSFFCVEAAGLRELPRPPLQAKTGGEGNAGVGAVACEAHTA